MSSPRVVLLLIADVAADDAYGLYYTGEALVILR